VNTWIKQIFQAGQVAKGNIVRRKKSSVTRYATLAQLEAEVRKRKFHLIETGDQVIVICNSGNIKIVV
jgi:phage baseplate assembly protein gpV